MQMSHCVKLSSGCRCRHVCEPGCDVAGGCMSVSLCVCACVCFFFVPFMFLLIHSFTPCMCTQPEVAANQQQMNFSQDHVSQNS